MPIQAVGNEYSNVQDTGGAPRVKKTQGENSYVSHENEKQAIDWEKNICKTHPVKNMCLEYRKKIL